MPSTVRDLNELTAPAANDFVLVADISDVVDKDKKMLVGKFPLKNGTPTAARVASWTDANQIQDAGFATTEVARLGTAQTNTALKTFSAGLSFGLSTLQNYDQSLTVWNVTITGTGGNPTLSYATRTSRYTRIGDVCFYSFYIVIGTTSGGAGGVLISLPLPAAAGNANNTIGNVQVHGPTWSTLPINQGIGVQPGTQTAYIFGALQSSSITSLQISGLHNGDVLIGSGWYWV